MVLLSFLLINIVIAIVIRVYCRLTCGTCKCSRHLVGKVVIVTGANTGIGYETAKDMAERGARVILACRSETRGTAARDKIIELTGNTDVHFRRLDLGSLACVRAFANITLKTETRLDILINNAGIYSSRNVKTEDGLLECMQINHFAPFLLTTMLLPLLKSSAPSRIINVSSGVYTQGQIDFDDLNYEKGVFSQHQVYSNSKLCNVLMTLELDRRLKETGVTANCLHPGFVETNILDMSQMGILKYVAFIGKIVTKNACEGAQTSIYLSVSPEVAEQSGKFYRDCFEVSIAKQAQDPEIARKLWEVSEQLVLNKSK